jgi:prepilin-type N-terminal cleavage/methylation domain-containing protein
MGKQGFSIIELMVTVVIMGVLAAVAVPKLFGLFDKTKASEISLAAGTYIKLQDLYVYEHHKTGNWHDIGYKSPAGNSLGRASTSTFAYEASQAQYNWSAEALISLNKCAKGSKWFINFHYDGGQQVSYWASSEDETNCKNALTPNFSKIGNTTTPITTPGGKE